MAAWLRPASLPEAVAALAADPTLRILAGGTDLYPQLGEAAIRQPMLDLSGLGLSGIHGDAVAGWRIGAMTPWATIARAALPPGLHALQEAAREVGAHQIQASGTIAGNIVNASPAADGTVALLALGAVVEITGPSGPREVALHDFVTGPRRVALSPGDIVTALRIPATGGQAVSGFAKLGSRKYLVISIAMVAAQWRLVEGRIHGARLAVGACAPVALRLPALEARLEGAAPARAASLIRPGDCDALRPISDIRATAEYRRAAVPVLLARLMERMSTESAA